MSTAIERCDNLYQLVQALGVRLQARNLTVTAAESCTGGGIAQAFTTVPGSSTWFQAGFVTYADWAKTRYLGVKPESLRDFGAVSEPVALEMAAGALRAGQADFAVAATGIAGPDGGSEQKPVGTVWLAWTCKGSRDKLHKVSQCYHFSGDRDQIRKQAVAEAVTGLLRLLEESRA